MNSVRILNKERSCPFVIKNPFILHFGRTIPICKLLFVGNRVVKHNKEDHPMSVNDA